MPLPSADNAVWLTLAGMATRPAATTAQLFRGDIFLLGHRLDLFGDYAVLAACICVLYVIRLILPFCRACKNGWWGRAPCLWAARGQWRGDIVLCQPHRLGDVIAVCQIGRNGRRKGAAGAVGIFCVDAFVL